jgi:hypothetical protein
MIKLLKDLKSIVETFTERERIGTIKMSLFPSWRLSDESSSLLRTRRIPVIVIQGYMMKRESMYEIDNALKNAGFAPISFHLKRLGVDKGVEELAIELRMYLEILFKNNFNGMKRTLRIPAIGFSMGGVILHYIIRAMDGCSFIDRVITISSPINGLKYTVLALPFKNLIKPLRSAYDLWEGSEFIKKLKKKPYPPSCYFVSISSDGDWMAPPSACMLPTLPNTKNILLKRMFHSDLPFSDEVSSKIIELLLETENKREFIMYF